MNFKAFWDRITLPPGPHMALIHDLCQSAYEKGFSDGFEMGYDDGFHTGDDHGYFDRQTDLRLVK